MLVRVLQNQNRQSRGGVNLVDAYGGVEYEGDQQEAEDENDVDTDTGIAEILALGLAPDEQAAEINAFVTKKFVRRGTAGGAPRGRPERPTGPGRFPPRSASVPARPPPRDRADIQCIICNRKGHTAQDCRQPRVEKYQRKCFLCDKPGHVARDCKERKAPIKVVEQRGNGQPAFLGCVQIADADGFTPVKRGLRQQEANLGDFIRTSTAERKSHAARCNRFRELTVDDLNLIATSEGACRGGGHPLLTRQVEPKPEVSSMVDFPVLSPSGQGEIGCAPMPALPSPAPQAETANVVAYLKDQDPI